MEAPRMRTINEAMDWLKKADPGTAITPHALRRLIVSGELPHVMIGRKYLINLHTLEDYLKANHKT